VIKFNRYLNTSTPWRNWKPLFRDLSNVIWICLFYCSIQISAYLCAVMQLNSSIPWFILNVIRTRLLHCSIQKISAYLYSMMQFNTFIPWYNWIFSEYLRAVMHLNTSVPWFVSKVIWIRLLHCSIQMITAYLYSVMQFNTFIPWYNWIFSEYLCAVMHLNTSVPWFISNVIWIRLFHCSVQMVSAYLYSVM